GGRAADRLRDERGYRVGARALDRVLERRPAAGRAGRVVAAAAAAVRVGRGYALDVDEPLAEGKLVLLARRGREGQQGVPVIGRVERDDTMLAGLAGLDPVLPGELQGGLDRFRAAGEEIELVELARERGGELAGELLHRAMGERGGRDVAELARLARQRLRDLRIQVAEIRDVGAAHGVEVALPLLVVQPAALTPHDARVAAAELAVEDVAIGIAVVRHSSPFPVVRGPRKAMRRPVYRRGALAASIGRGAAYCAPTSRNRAQSAVALSTYIASGW